MDHSWLRLALVSFHLLAPWAAGQSSRIGDWSVFEREPEASEFLGSSMQSLGMEWPKWGTRDMPMVSFACSKISAVGVSMGFTAGRNLGRDDIVRVNVLVDDAPPFTDHWEIVATRSRLVPPMKSLEELLPRLIGSSMLRIEVVVPRNGLFFPGGTYQYGFKTGGFEEAFRTLGCYRGSVALLSAE